MTAPNARHLRPAEDAAARVAASGVAWRLRSLVAMGHDCTRIAEALEVPAPLVRRVVAGRAQTVTATFRDGASQLWNAWWDKTPPARTPAERRAAAVAVRHARAAGWPAAAGLDEECLDLPGYQPTCRYMPAAGTGTAADFRPARPEPAPDPRLAPPAADRAAS